MPHQAGQGNAHRADALAAAAEGRGVGQVGCLLDADQLRRQDRADRAGVDPAIGMAADRAVDRAMVHAGAAADAAQHVLHPGAEHRGAAVVEQHDVVLRRPVEIAIAFRPGVEGRVGRGFLAGRRARQHAQQHRGILERRDHLLDAGQHDVHLGQRVGEIGIAFVGDQHRRTRLGHQEVGTGQADVGIEEFLAQHMARLGHQVVALREASSEAERPMMLEEGVGHLVFGQMHRRRDDVAGRLVAQLDDVLAEIGFDRRDADLLEMIVERDLLRHHRL